jgi:hypothetical protein
MAADSDQKPGILAFGISGKLYDGVELEIGKTLLVPERITHKRVNDIVVPLDKIPSNYYF